MLVKSRGKNVTHISLYVGLLLFGVKSTTFFWPSLWRGIWIVRYLSSPEPRFRVKCWVDDIYIYIYIYVYLQIMWPKILVNSMWHILNYPLNTVKKFAYDKESCNLLQTDTITIFALQRHPFVGSLFYSYLSGLKFVYLGFTY